MERKRKIEACYMVSESRHHNCVGLDSNLMKGIECYFYFI